MDTRSGIFTAIVITLVILNVAGVSGQPEGNTTLTLTPLDNGHLTTKFVLECSFTYTDTNSVVRNTFFFRKREIEATFSEFARVELKSSPVYSWNDTQLRQRSTLHMFENKTRVRMEISNTQCNDQAQYRCAYLVADRFEDKSIFGVDKQLVVTAPPQKPQLTYTPEKLLENEEATFTCSGNVGLPAGTLGIYVVKNGQDVDLNANNGLAETEVNSCTFLRTATVKYNFTAEDDARTRVRCKAQQAYANDVVHSDQTDMLSVMYTPRNTVMYRAVDNGQKLQIPAGQTIEVPVQSSVLLECETQSSPASLYEWSYVLTGSNNTGTENPTSRGQFQIEHISQDRAGTYKCRVSNRIRNSTFTDEVSFKLNVSSIPTIPPTLPSTEDPGSTGTQTDTTTKAGEVSQPSQAGIIAGAVVAAVVVVIIIIIIVIFLMRRKRDNKDHMNEMDNKPRNNQDIPRVVVHPQSVTPNKFDKYNKGFEKNEKELEYADLKFDDTPRSRKPVQILYEPTNYAEVAWPRV